MRNLVLALAAGLAFLSCQQPESQSSNEQTPVHSVADTPAVDTAKVPEVMEEKDDFSDIKIEELLGQIDQSRDSNFVRISSKYTGKPKIFLRKEAYEAFERMHAAAAADGIRLEIISATRNFGYQKGIWERKWTGVTKVGGKNLAQALPDPVERARKILNYSSMPGTSRHHWGTDIDLNSLNNSWFEQGAGKKVYDWLQAHAAEYGYCQTYTAFGDDRPFGYNEEKWHWSYTPISSRFLQAYAALLDTDYISGFKGAIAAEDLSVIQVYVMGVNSDCK